MLLHEMIVHLIERGNTESVDSLKRYLRITANLAYIRKSEMSMPENMLTRCFKVVPLDNAQLLRRSVTDPR